MAADAELAEKVCPVSGQKDAAAADINVRPRGVDRETAGDLVLGGAEHVGKVVGRRGPFEVVKNNRT